MNKDNIVDLIRQLCVRLFSNPVIRVLIKKLGSAILFCRNHIKVVVFGLCFAVFCIWLSTNKDQLSSQQSSKGGVSEFAVDTADDGALSNRNYHISKDKILLIEQKNTASSDSKPVIASAHAARSEKTASDAHNKQITAYAVSDGDANSAHNSAKPSIAGVVAKRSVAVATPHYDRAMNYVKEGKYGDAIESFEQAIANKENILDSHYRLGNLYRFIVGDNEKAVYHLNRYVALKNQSPDAPEPSDILEPAENEQYRKALALFKKGGIKAGQGDFTGARDLFVDALQMYPNEPLIMYNLATVYHKLGDIKNAIATYKKTVAIDPMNAPAYFGLGVAYQQDGNSVGAIDAYNRALAINPKHISSLNNIAVLYERIGMLDEAKERYNQIIVLKPKYARAYNNLGIIYARQNKYDEAIKLLNTALKLDKTYLEPRYNLARIYEQTDRIDKALEQYRFIYLYDNSYADVEANIERLEAKLAELNRPEKSIKTTTAPIALATPVGKSDKENIPAPAISESSSKSIPARNNADKTVSKENPSDVFAPILDALAIRVDRGLEDPVLYNDLAGYAHEKGYYNALGYLEDAVHAFPENQKIRFLFAQLLSNEKYYYRAMNEYAVLLEKNPDEAEGYYRLSLLYIDKNNPLKDTRRALQLYQKYNELGGHKPLPIKEAQEPAFETEKTRTFTEQLETSSE